MHVDREYFEIVYDEYKSELAASDSLYQRATVLITGLVIIGGASASMGRLDLLRFPPDRWELLVAQVAVCLVAIAAIVATVQVFIAIWPRSYPKLTKLFFWSRWRERYWNELTADDPSDEERNRQALSDATIESITERLVDAQAWAAYYNQKRLLALQRGILWAGFAFVAVILQAGCLLVLRAKGL